MDGAAFHTEVAKERAPLHNTSQLYAEVGLHPVQQRGEGRLPIVNEKQHARELIDQLPPHQLSAVVGLLEAMLDPVSRKLAAAPIDDEPETEEDRQNAEQSKEWLRQRGGKGIPHEEVLQDLGLTMEDFRCMAHDEKD